MNRFICWIICFRIIPLNEKLIFLCLGKKRKGLRTFFAVVENHSKNLSDVTDKPFYNVFIKMFCLIAQSKMDMFTWFYNHCQRIFGLLYSSNISYNKTRPYGIELLIKRIILEHKKHIK